MNGFVVNTFPEQIGDDLFEISVSSDDRDQMDMLVIIKPCHYIDVIKDEKNNQYLVQCDYKTMITLVKMGIGQ